MEGCLFICAVWMKMPKDMALGGDKQQDRVINKCQTPLLGEKTNYPSGFVWRWWEVCSFVLSLSFSHSLTSLVLWHTEKELEQKLQNISPLTSTNLSSWSHPLWERPYRPCSLTEVSCSLWCRHFFRTRSLEPGIQSAAGRAKNNARLRKRWSGRLSDIFLLHWESEGAFTSAWFLRERR